MDLHRLAEERSLALHAAIETRLRKDPALIGRARERVRGWLSDGSVHRFYAERWRALLDGPDTLLFATLASTDEEDRALRQVTPFAGVVPAKERWAIWRDVRRKSGL